MRNYCFTVNPTDGICPVGYQMLQTVDPPVLYNQQTCSYYEPPNCVQVMNT